MLLDFQKLFVMFQVINFSSQTIAGFIAMVGILSIIAQVQSFISRCSFMSWYMSNAGRMSVNVHGFILS